MRPFARLTGRMAPLPVANVDTDQIIPARFLKVVTSEGMGRGLFASWRFHDDGSPRENFVLNRPEHEGALFLLAGDNFGCGSSREHAAWALLDHGFRAVVSTRFADIFRTNAAKNGLLAATVSAAHLEALMATATAAPDEAATIDLERCRIEGATGEAIPFGIDAFARRCLLDGSDQLDFILERKSRIAAYETARPDRVSTLGRDRRDPVS
jgi:3-isopropylmalate/(R)-2-methylmalate dehydratase small subunit